MGNSAVLVMYDIRRIQDYIYKTSKVKDAVGASAIVENIIEEALAYSAKKEGIESVDLAWDDENGYIEYTGDNKEIQVLYIGGGNAFVLFKDRELSTRINRRMSKYVIDKTYSLQLAIACVDCTGNYASDYKNIYDEMNQVKARMSYSAPLGALPIFDIDVKTGQPITINQNNQHEYITTETKEKLKSERFVKRTDSKEFKRFEVYSTNKGVDSTIAIVHIDGNNMGTRIKGLLENKETYVDAVNEMRKISHNINYSYKNAFDEMEKYFNSLIVREGKKSLKNYVLKILTAGDDITYVCNGKIALATVEHFCKLITEKTMNGESDEASIKEYGFSVCAGISYQHDHFPFFIGYQVAEECCDNAKTKAKKTENKDGDRIGNYVDFQICKNIQSLNLSELRAREYITPNGEILLTRPYYIPVNNEFALSKNGNKEDSLSSFKKYINIVSDEKLPRGFAKRLRNTYPEGEDRVNELVSFLESRNKYLGSKEDGAFYIIDGRKYARFYDALELMDDYVDIGSNKIQLSVEKEDTNE